MAKKIGIFAVIFLVSLAFRYQTIHVPFWVDEFSSANQALLMKKFGTEFFTQKDHYAEPRNLTTYALIAVSFTLFGVTEEAARLPSELIGSLVPVAVFLLCTQLYPKRKSVWFSATLLSITSYFLIVWSRQARGYSLQQFCILLSTYTYLQFFSKSIITEKVKWLLATLLVVTIGVFTHPTFLFVAGCFFIHSVIFSNKSWLSVLKNKTVLALSASLGIIALFFLAKTVFIPQVFAHIQLILTQGVRNNIWYYHSFLWREYGLVSLLGVFGLAYIFRLEKKRNSVIVFIMGAYLTFFSFFFPSNDTRYLLPIFPFLLIGMAMSIQLLVESVVSKQMTMISCLLVTLLVIANGHKFDLKPSPFYSVNHDFREIALIDYDQVYNLIKQKGDLQAGKTAVIDTWSDRLEWYLGLDYHANYVFRWEDAGFMRQTPFSLQPNGDKVVLQRTQTKLISTQQDLLKVMETYPKGFIWIDDASLPEDVRVFVEKNFKKELYLDHYPLDDNPYSIWPGTLYSWGV